MHEVPRALQRYQFKARGEVFLLPFEHFRASIPNVKAVLADISRLWQKLARQVEQLADGNTPQKIVKRARIILMTAVGHGVMAIMREVGVSKTTV
jgi:hypothetical protein